MDKIEFQHTVAKNEIDLSFIWMTLITIEVPVAASTPNMVVNSKKIMPLVDEAYCSKKLQKIGFFFV